MHLYCHLCQKHKAAGYYMYLFLHALTNNICNIFTTAEIIIHYTLTALNFGKKSSVWFLNEKQLNLYCTLIVDALAQYQIFFIFMPKKLKNTYFI